MRPTITVRARRPDDVPRLVELLAEQQPTSEYPLRWPLPFPVEEFLVRADEEAAWVAVDEDDTLFGHVAVTSASRDPDDPVGTAFRTATGRDDVAVVSVLFTSLAARGTGAGGLLHDTAVAWIRDQGRPAVLDVVPTHEAAVGLYRRRGWVEVGTLRPPWLPPGRPDLVLMTLS